MQMQVVPNVNRTIAFLGVPAQAVDEVLEHLCAAAVPLSRCMVFLDQPQLLGVLEEQWRGRVEIVAIIVSSPMQDKIRGIELIAEIEAGGLTNVVWVCVAAAQHSGCRQGRFVAFCDDSSTRVVARRIALELMAL
ncbi:MAG: hypothetical protein KBF65_00095 [Rubrivivax sp.]|nr:hypothetical protein [Rubrivivax sp.]